MFPEHMISKRHLTWALDRIIEVIKNLPNGSNVEVSSMIIEEIHKILSDLNSHQLHSKEKNIC